MIKCASRIENWSVDFCGRRKTGEPRENTSQQGENQQQTQCICDASSRIPTQATLIEPISLTTVPTLLPTAFGELNLTAYMYIHTIMQYSSQTYVSSFLCLDVLVSLFNEAIHKNRLPNQITKEKNYS